MATSADRVKMDGNLREIGVPLSRAQTLITLAEAVLDGRVDLSGATPVQTVYVAGMYICAYGSVQKRRSPLQVGGLRAGFCQMLVSSS